MKKLKKLHFIILFTIGTSLTSFAQSFGVPTGDKFDTFIINNDRSNNKSEFRMQNRSISFTLSNLSNRMALSYSSIYKGWANNGTEIFSVNTNGSTTMSTAFVGLTIYGSDWAGFSHESMKGTPNYSLLASKSGKLTLINKADTDDGYIGFRVGNIDKMVLSNSGNLGIGTTTPNRKLHVNGNAIITGNTKINGTTNFDDTVTLTKGMNIRGDITSYDTFNVSGTLNFANTDISQQITINKGLNLRLTNIPDSHFSVKNAFGADALYIDTDGKIAIGSVSSESLTEQLNVDGRIKAGGFIADASSFPDYVFANDYQLMSLEAIKAYTTKHHKLPDMPTEKEVINNGLNIKKVMTVSVEKIEELYLHAIAQQELIIQQRKEILALKKSLKDQKESTKIQKENMDGLHKRLEQIEQYIKQK
ncbi:hypothetical protein D1818_21920 [Aquimarina sp. BL5]|uniref:hypothetical protein n=1 Tax=Aquimarina sp. BL5 TaxID=1714860 RepID=UPI000E4A2ACE|nr:hypothetical protein [Aquimarina sp. BL5]AXT53354.1 hypothetical protein D1818_21920 [Aquimarina sp. BL5]RKN06185.1 hypothetical protein D7036_09360 [Aquimarina sp. BL5]